MSKVSNCCGAPPRGNGDNDTEDYGICPDCKEHCEYISQEDFDWLNFDDHDEPQDFSADLFKVMRETKK